VNIRKAVIIFISDDWRRPIMQYPVPMLRCLQSPRNCSGGDILYGIPDDQVEADAEIARLARQRAVFVANAGRLKARSERVALYHRLLKPIYQRAKAYIRPRPPAEDAIFENSRRALMDIVGGLGAENVLLIHLPQKEELDHGPNGMSLKERDVVRQAGLKLVDGFTACGLAPQDFLVHDGHPNAGGYHKIALCVERAVTEAWHPQVPVASER